MGREHDHESEGLSSEIEKQGEALGWTNQHSLLGCTAAAATAATATSAKNAQNEPTTDRHKHIRWHCLKQQRSTNAPPLAATTSASTPHTHTQTDQDSTTTATPSPPPTEAMHTYLNLAKVKHPFHGHHLQHPVMERRLRLPLRRRGPAAIPRVLPPPLVAVR